MSRWLHVGGGGGIFSFELYEEICYVLYFGHKILLPNSFSTAAVQSNWKWSQQDLKHCYSSLFKKKKKGFVAFL